VFTKEARQVIRQSLLQQGRKLFLRYGLRKTNVGELARAAGIAKGTFYHFFDSKEELFTEILRTAQNDMRRTQQRRIEGVDDPVERLQLGIRAAVLWMAQHDDLRRLFEFARTETSFNGAMKAGQRVLVADAVAIPGLVHAEKS